MLGHLTKPAHHHGTFGLQKSTEILSFQPLPANPPAAQGRESEVWREFRHGVELECHVCPHYFGFKMDLVKSWRSAWL
jgi:hypothetical protein